MDPNKREQTTNEATPSRKRAKKIDANPSAEMKLPKVEDDVLNVIEGVESQLIAMRQAHESHRQAMKELAKLKRENEDQTKELEGRESELTTREVELAEMRQDFESREMNLIQRAGGLEQRESKIATQAELLEQQEADIETKDKTLDVKIQELDSQLAGLSKRKTELGEIEKQVKLKLAEENDAAEKLSIASGELESANSLLQEMGSKISSTNEQLLETQSAHKAAVTDLAASKDAHETAAKELKTTVSKLRGREIELTERSHTLEELAEKAGGLEHDLSTSREQYSGQLTEATEQFAREQKVVEGLRAQVEMLETERDHALSSSSNQTDAVNAKLKQATAELESMRQAANELGEQGQQSEGRVGKLTQDLADSQKQIETLTAQVNEIAGSADEELTTECARIGDFESKIASLTKQLEDSSTRQSSLETELQSKPQVDPAMESALKEQVEKAQEESLTLEIKLEEAATALVSLRDNLAVRDEEVAKSNAKVQELSEQATELFETIEKLGTQLEEAQSSPKVEVSDWNKDRRTRLQKMRRVLAGDAEKIRMATEALRSRYDQCEQVLTKRAELAEAYEAIASAQRKYQGREVRSGVFLGLIGMAAITMVLAATSWFVSDRVTPGMYAAKVTMAASSGDSTLSEAEMEQWEVYITQLATDPRFLEVAADRMKRRGIAEFSIPGDLSREMEHSLDVISAMPGTIVMEYRGEGAARSARVLDTFTVALSSAANAARARRADSSMTIIESVATAGDEPLDTRRIEMAGMIFGGSMLFVMILGGIMWKRLSAAKAKFEDDSRIEALFDEAEWQMPG
ncbi:hypothetical protein COB72_02720 [bacterium]|nr:MAG: hypothetical protein COB72_02720 [bacterium]